MGAAQERGIELGMMVPMDQSEPRSAGSEKRVQTLRTEEKEGSLSRERVSYWWA